MASIYFLDLSPLVTGHGMFHLFGYIFCVAQQGTGAAARRLRGRGGYLTDDFFPLEVVVPYLDSSNQPSRFAPVPAAGIANPNKYKPKHSKAQAARRLRGRGRYPTDDFSPLKVAVPYLDSSDQPNRFAPVPVADTANPIKHKPKHSKAQAARRLRTGAGQVPGGRLPPAFSAGRPTIRAGAH